MIRAVDVPGEPKVEARPFETHLCPIDGDLPPELPVPRGGSLAWPDRRPCRDVRQPADHRQNAPVRVAALQSAAAITFFAKGNLFLRKAPIDEAHPVRTKPARSAEMEPLTR